MFGTLLDRLYYLKPPKRTRAPARPMEVLCLGFSECGTSSLRSALEILGYNEVYGEALIIARQREDLPFWASLINRKFKQNKSQLNGIDFDEVLGNCQAVTGSPANIFGEELVQYYPHAKVILDRRRDTNKWCSSVLDASKDSFSQSFWLLSWFNSQLYYLWQTSHLVLQDYFDHNFEQNGKSYAKRHMVNLTDCLTNNNRSSLQWAIEDGWAPLCAYLGKPVPDKPFPDVNREASQAIYKRDSKDMVSAATRNLSITVALLSLCLYYWRSMVLMLLIQLYRLAMTSRVKEEIYPDMAL